LFKANDLHHALDYLGRMFGMSETAAVPLAATNLVSTPALIALALACALASPLWPRLRPLWYAAAKEHAVAGDLARAAYVGVVLLLSLATMVLDQNSPFLYFRF